MTRSSRKEVIIKTCTHCGWNGMLEIHSAPICPSCGKWLNVRPRPIPWVELTPDANQILKTITRKTGRTASDVVEEALMLYFLEKGESDE